MDRHSLTYSTNANNSNEIYSSIYGNKKNEIAARAQGISLDYPTLPLLILNLKIKILTKILKNSSARSSTEETLISVVSAFEHAVSLRERK